MKSIEDVEQAYITITQWLAENSTLSPGEVENVKNSGARVAKGFYQMVLTRNDLVQELRDIFAVRFPTDTTEPQLVMQSGIKAVSLCPHHLLPIESVVHYGYITEPGNSVIGLSKFVRIAQVLARRAVIQETYTQDLADVMRLGTVGTHLIGKPVSPHVGVVVNASHGCFDGQTEILTEKGWVRFDKLKQGIRVAQVDLESMQTTLTTPTEYIKYPVKNEGMHYYNSQKTNLFMTDNHRVVLRSSWKHLNSRESSPWEVIEAKDVPSEFYVPTKIDWQGGVSIEDQEFDGMTVRASKYLALLGLYFAEGCNRRNGIEIVQKIGTESHDKMEKLIYSLGFPVSEYVETKWDCKHWYINAPELAQHLLKYGRTCKKMRIPKYVQNAPQEQIQKFMDWYYLGDGDKWHLVKPEAERGHNFVIHTASKKMARDLQLMYFKLGLYCTIQNYEGETFMSERHGLSGMHYKVWQNIGKTREFEGVEGAFLRTSNREIVNYTGNVYCVSVPTGAIVIRRNEKISVIGNCMSCRGVMSPSRTQTSLFTGLLSTPMWRSDFFRGIEETERRG